MQMMPKRVRKDKFARTEIAMTPYVVDQTVI